MTERTVRAEAAIREAAADFIGELSTAETLEDVNELHKQLRALERYLERITDAAADKAELILRSRD